ncbi:type II toxin-antitoxin system RelE family toxin [Lactovum odontotermitis]
MAYKFKFNNTAEKQFLKLDKPVKMLILDYLEKNIDGTEQPRLFGKALQGDKRGLWRYRVGKYRLIVQILDDELLILGIAVGKRGDIYQR